MPDRFVLDTSVFRRLPEREHDVVAKLLQLKAAQRVQLLSTHVQREELAATRDEQWREQLLSVYDALTVEVSTGGFVLDASVLDKANLMRDQQADDFERDLRTPLTHYRADSGEPLCGDVTASPAFTHGDQAATCPMCRAEQGQTTHPFRNRKTGDALIIETAAEEDAQYVAGDHGARMRAEQHGLVPWDVDEFFAWVLRQ